MKPSCCLLFLLLISTEIFAQVHKVEFGDSVFMRYDFDIAAHGYIFNDSLESGKWIAYSTKDTNLIMAECTFVIGRKNGREIVFYENDSIQMESNYVDGKKDGMFVTYYYDRKVEWRQSYVNGVRHGYFTRWWTNGNKWDETYYEMGKTEGVQSEWYYNGQKDWERTWKNNELNGPYISWGENGQKLEEGNYKGGVDYTGKRTFFISDGEWKYWNEKGELIKIERYDNGKLIELKQLVDPNIYRSMKLYLHPLDSTRVGTIELCDSIPPGFYQWGVAMINDSAAPGYMDGSPDGMYTDLGTSPADNFRVYSIMTTNPNYRTVTGIGVGSTIQEILDAGEELQLMMTDYSTLILRLKKSGISVFLDYDSAIQLYYNDSKTLDDISRNGFVKLLSISTKSCPN